MINIFLILRILQLLRLSLSKHSETLPKPSSNTIF